MENSGVRIDITIGRNEVLRSPRWYIQSERGKYLGRAGITLPDPERELWKSIQKGDAVEICLGYRNHDPVFWQGTVAGCGPGETKDQVEIIAIDSALPLTTTYIVQSWENETPEAIVKWAIGQSGLQVGQIDVIGMVLPRFVASNIPVWQVARQAEYSCYKAFGIDMSDWAFWLGANGVNWGNFDEPGDIALIATGGGLIDHVPADGPGALSKVETFLLPDLMHSRRIHLQDDYRGIDGTFRALRVRHEGTPDRVRTCIWYGALDE